MKNKDFISVITPVYGERELVSVLYNEITKVISDIDVDYEIIMVNDGCPFGSGEEIEKLAQSDKHVKFIDFSRNFGQHNAIKAGLDYSNGDYAVIMDCDLQDNPKYIPDFYKKIKENDFDIIFGKMKSRNDNTIKKLLSNVFNYINKKCGNFSQNEKISNFSIISKKVISKIKSINNYAFSYPSVLNWLGFKTGFIEVFKDNRILGKSKYNLFKSIKLALSVIISNSNKPLMFAVFCSMFFLTCCFIFIIKLIIDYYTKGIPIIGWTSLMVSIFLIGGLLFAYLSLLGLYIGNIFTEVKKRPLYIVKKTMNINE